MPSFQENVYALGDLQRQIACTPLASAPARERRFPFLDRDLLEFLYNIPREQLVQPGRRRFLMRRALRGIVPEPLLERKRKAYVVRTPLQSLQAQSKELTEWTKEMICCEIGAIDLAQFQRALAQAFQGDDSHLWRFSRTLELESWLRDTRVQSVLSSSALHIAARRAPTWRRIEPRTVNESPQLGKSNKKEVKNMKYEKPEIVCVDDAAKSIQQMQKDVIAQDHSNGTLRPPAFQADE